MNCGTSIAGARSNRRVSTLIRAVSGGTERRRLRDEPYAASLGGESMFEVREYEDVVAGYDAALVTASTPKR